MPLELKQCPACNAALSDWEQKERECFSCGWNEAEFMNDTVPNAPPGYEWDREFDDETMD